MHFFGYYLCINGASYNGSTCALGAYSLSSILNAPTKVLMQVSYIGITSAFQADERGSTPLTRSQIKNPTAMSCFLF